MEVVDIKYLGSNDQYQTYTSADASLINTALITANYGDLNDYVEYFVKDLTNTVLSGNYYSTKYNIGSVVDPITNTTTKLYLDPETDARDLGYDRGIVNVKYNFFSKQLLSSPDPSQNFWIKEISTSRTEIKVARQDLSNTQLLDTFTAFNAKLAADPYYPDFYLNFGADIQLIAINAVYIEENGNGYMLFKLYEPLPSQFDLKSTFWVVTQVADSVEFNVTINVTPETILDTTPIKGPNFKVSINDKVGQTTPYYNYLSLLATSVTSSYQQLQSMMQEQGIDINVDYSSFSNFIHYSSATNRLYNFTYKVQLIESASAGLVSTNTSTAKVILQSQIDSIITNFDGYEYYLYFTSESTAWPKQNNTTPYSLYSLTSSQVTNWLGNINTLPTANTMSMYWSSSYYDDQNKDLLLYATPSYIVDDSTNQPYLLFLNMIGQSFDNIWIYLKDVTNHYAAYNNPNVGISMDLVADAIRSMGIQLYTNTSVSDNIYYSLLGINQTGSSLPITSSQYATINYASSSLYPLAGQHYLTASLYLPPFGEELINRFVTTFVTSSLNVTQSFGVLPDSQITAEIYKRIYHNLPYLLKAKGTRRGLQALATIYGVPSDILTVHEYGGYDFYQTPGIQEITNNRILTGSVLEISSSLLSPYSTLQYYSYTLDKTSGDIEVAFSPADSINANITSSGYVTSSTQPGYFNIMQLIGAPDLQYSSSYTPLVSLENTYFDATYTRRYNVWDFIRTVKYYNNSLFKMLRDFIPARASADTGIVIKSHMLERNKYPRHEPTYTTSSADAEYVMVAVTGSDGGSIVGSTAYVEAIPIQYSSYSTPLSGSIGVVYMNSTDDVQKYTGELSGSTIVATTNYFSQNDISTYAFPTTSSVAPSLHGGQNILFLTYSLGPLYENVTENVVSQKFLDLDYNGSQLAPTNYGLVTQSLSKSLVIGPVSQSTQPYSQYAQIQDFNYYSRPSVELRYSGSQLSGLYYNVYTPLNSTYSGDISNGTDPVINYYTDKLGFFTQIATSSFLPGQVNATLGYLADVSGGLFELNQNNKHWQDVQNIFKAGTSLTIKQFDNKKYSNQKSTDGVKTIYNSGYSYTPQLYFASGSDDKVYFQYAGNSTGNFIAFNSKAPSNGYISGSTSISYPVVLTCNTTRAGNIYCAFDSSDPSSNYTGGTVGNFACYSVAQNGQKTFTVNTAVCFQFQDPSPSGANCQTSGSYTFGVYCNASSTALCQQSVNFTSSYSPAACNPGAICTNGRAQQSSPSGYTLITGYGLFCGPFSIDGGACQGDNTTQVCVAVYCWCNISGPNNGPLVKSVSGTAISPIFTVDSLNCCPTRITSITSATNTPSINRYTACCNISFTTAPIDFTPGDKAIFKFTQGGMSSANFTSSLVTSAASSCNNSLALGIIAIGAGGYPYATASIGSNPNGWYISCVCNDSSLTSDIVFTPGMSQFYQYQQIPYFVSGGITYSSSLYNSPAGSGSYGDINYIFNPQFGDKIVMSDYAGITQTVDIISSSLDGSNQLNVRVAPQILSNWETTPSSIYKMLILKRYNDEQNIILTFNKTPGQTSYGFTIPNTINPVVTANINALQAAVQSQLLSNQANTTTQ